MMEGVGVLKRKWFIVRTLVGYLGVLIVGILFFVPALILIALLPESWRRTNKLIFRLLHYTYAGVVRCVGLHIVYKGERKELPRDPAIIIANHESALDIPVVGFLCHGYPHMWYVLDYYARKPVLGFFVRRMGISVTRDNGSQAARSLLQGLKKTADLPCHTILFPEGGRFVDGTVHRFLGGFAVLARKTGRPVVPIFLKNLGTVLPPDHLMLVDQVPIEVIIGPLYYYEASETDEQFVARVYGWFEQRQ